MGPCHPNPRYNASFPSDFAPQFALLKVADAESCSAKSSALLERNSFKAIPCYSISVQRSADTVCDPCMCRACAHVAHATLCLPAVLPTRDS